MNIAETAQVAHDVAELIYEASQLIAKANALMEANGLNLENYPEYWHDFSEHSTELRNIFVTDFKDVQIEVGH